MKVFCDFDGTITAGDATDFVLANLANPEWELIEEEWKSGLIGSGECMRRQIALIPFGRDKLDSTLDRIDIDPYFLTFSVFCRSRGIPLTIVSDGVDYFIQRILARFNITGLPVIANHLIIGDGNYQLISPYSSPECVSASGVCKCRIVKAIDSLRIYVGDGRSDFCVAGKRPELIFAKGKLAVYCKQNGIPFTAYETFEDVMIVISNMIHDQSETKAFITA